jgi:peptidoglycan/LPS O-acetylase OafA/YrhL
MSRLLTIQVARGIAANLVLVSHLFVVQAKYTAGGILPAFTLYGLAGVDLFFVLSGFIMVAVAGRGVGPIQFLWRRATRIYPTYWLISLAVLAGAILAPSTVNSSIPGPTSLWRSFLLIPNQTPPLLAVGWTLVHEVYFYVTFAIFLALRIPILVGLMGWGFVILLVLATVPVQVMELPVLRLATSPLTAEFMIGAIVGFLWTKRVVPGAIAAGVAGIAGLMLSIVYTAPKLSLATSPHLDAWRVLVFGLPSGLVIYAITGAEQLRPSWLQATKALVALGDWSYSTYLAHVLVVVAIGRLIFLLAPTGGVGASVALIAIGLPAANFTGAVIYTVFERRALAWLHQLRFIRQPVKPFAKELVE